MNAKKKQHVNRILSGYIEFDWNAKLIFMIFKMTVDGVSKDKMIKLTRIRRDIFLNSQEKIFFSSSFIS